MRLSSDADRDCCSVNKAVRGCSSAVCAEDTDGVTAIFKMSHPWFFSMQRHCRWLQSKCSGPLLKEHVSVFGLIVFSLSPNSAMLR